jgi:hypothetical protein
VHEGCDRGGYSEQAQFAEEYGTDVHCEVRMLWTSGELQCG